MVFRCCYAVSSCDTRKATSRPLRNPPESSHWCKPSIHKSPITRAVLKLTMLPGLRPGAIAAASWDGIDLKASEWHAQAERMKMRHDHIVPLPKQAVALLSELQSLTGRGHYVFPSPPRIYTKTRKQGPTRDGMQGKAHCARIPQHAADRRPRESRHART
ncbi:tyrosine-type recombinase/integrase [Paraburkholderia sp. ZP32-5]|uniref:tyrosine-type recombinase/integrase n=1 Tax=Paraburkholderia sp. ZP32-5 TaxID=2883245 RepID=UPI003FA3437D